MALLQLGITLVGEALHLGDGGIYDFGQFLGQNVGGRRHGQLLFGARTIAPPVELEFRYTPLCARTDVTDAREDPMAEPEAFDQFVTEVSRGTWEVFRRDPFMYVVASVVLAVLAVLSLGLVAGPLTVGFIDMVRRGQRGEPLAISLLFSRFDTFVAGLVALIIVSIVVSLGMLLLVIPGLLAMLFATWVFHVIAFENTTGIAALERSVQLVRTYFAHTIALALVVSIAHAVGSLIFFGVLLSGPLSLIALTIGYERLTTQREADPQILSV